MLRLASPREGKEHRKPSEVTYAQQMLPMLTTLVWVATLHSGKEVKRPSKNCMRACESRMPVDGLTSASLHRTFGSWACHMKHSNKLDATDVRDHKLFGVVVQSHLSACFRIS